MRALLAVALLGCAGFTARISVQLRARAISEVIVARQREISPDFRVNACSVFLALDRRADFATLLDPPAARALGGDVAGGCSPARQYARGSGSWWEVAGIAEESGGRMVVRARLVVPFAAERDEEFRIRRDRSTGAVVVSEIRLARTIEKLTQPLVPPRVAPPR
ncbi:MAG TPA: hypothetical protein VF625_17470 [Longimicrobium sp.]|jgi:hypothetical protein